MQYVSNNKFLVISIIIFVVIVAVLVANLVAIINNGEMVEAPEIPREETSIGTGESLKYLILGDSTSIAQGGEYSKGFAVQTATKLSEKYTVTYKNVGVSGARIKDVATTQIENSKDFIPDVVLVAVGANDVTHLTSISSIKIDMESIISTLRDRNKNVKIVFTGAASMGNVKRFIQPFRWFMGSQTKDVNKAFEKLAKENNVTFAYVARETGQQFADHPEYFAQDKFHPNNEGYSVWTKVLDKAIGEALSSGSGV